MTQPSEYSKGFKEIGDAAGSLAVEIENKEYTNRAELQRDIARVLELWQKRVDLLKEVIVTEYPDYISPFGDF
jgi:hypothetical protein